jgi:hypothetical protein
MNEKINGLWDKAVTLVEQEPDGDWSLDTIKDKFAELIVQECINIGDNYEDILGNEPECFNCRKVAYGIVDKIKQHFGVEE